MMDNYIHSNEYNYSVHEYHYRWPRPCYHFTSVNEVLENHRNLAGPVLVGFTPKLGQCKQGISVLGGNLRVGNCDDIIVNVEYGNESPYTIDGF